MQQAFVDDWHTSTSKQFSILLETIFKCVHSTIFNQIE